ncbi:hypothetical protein [Amycolatopsis circi]|uniref:hypothetical protein n=1 Tax=Amycolatopsis circi TaxID=871959 RepID=UPI000E2503FC|nr:hypothetical protein [Amycolatopsis circi]
MLALEVWAGFPEEPGVRVEVVGAEAELLLGETPLTIRVPDVVVTSAEVTEAVYADAGIERYWIVDPPVKLDPRAQR